MTRIEANLDGLFRQAVLGSVPAAALYHKLQQEAAERERILSENALMAALEHREKWLEKFIEAEKLHLPLPDVFPDPRDVIITSDGIKVIGPSCKSDKILYDELAVQRDEYAKLALKLDDSAANDAEKRGTRRYLKKLYNAINDALAIKMQKSFEGSVAYDRPALKNGTPKFP